MAQEILNKEEFIRLLRTNLPRVLQEDKETKKEIFEIFEENFVPKKDYTIIIEEIKMLREETNRLREETNKIHERSDKLQEETKKIHERSDKIQERSDKLQEDSNKRFEEHSKEIRQISSTIGAIGARWGILSEGAFKEGLKSIIKEDLKFSLKKWKLHDKDGFVFGYPSDVEIDIAIHNQRCILVEIKSSVSRGDVSTFNKVTLLYEKENKVKADRKILVTPFIDTRAKELADKLNIVVTDIESFESRI